MKDILEIYCFHYGDSKILSIAPWPVPVLLMSSSKPVSNFLKASKKPSLLSDANGDAHAGVCAEVDRPIF